MTDKNDGGPAFPLPDPEQHYAGGRFLPAHAGMSLRDWFAGQIINGWLTSRTTSETRAIADGNSLEAVKAARASYVLADAMLAAREGGKP